MMRRENAVNRKVKNDGKRSKVSSASSAGSRCKMVVRTPVGKSKGLERDRDESGENEYDIRARGVTKEELTTTLATAGHMPRIVDLTNNGLDQIPCLPSRICILSLSCNRLRDLMDLEQLSNLQELDVSRNQLTSLEGLYKSSHTLVTINASHNTIVSVTGLETMMQLRHLDVSYNSIATVSHIRGLSCNVALAELRIKGNPVANRPNMRQIIMDLVPSLCTLDSLAVSVSPQIGSMPKGRTYSAIHACRTAGEEGDVSEDAPLFSEDEEIVVHMQQLASSSSKHRTKRSSSAPSLLRPSIKPQNQSQRRSPPQGRQSTPQRTERSPRTRISTSESRRPDWNKSNTSNLSESSAFAKSKYFRGAGPAREIALEETAQKAWATRNGLSPFSKVGSPTHHAHTPKHKLHGQTRAQSSSKSRYNGVSEQQPQTPSSRTYKSALDRIGSQDEARRREWLTLLKDETAEVDVNFDDVFSMSEGSRIVQSMQDSNRWKRVSGSSLQSPKSLSARSFKSAIGSQPELYETEQSLHNVLEWLKDVDSRAEASFQASASRQNARRASRQVFSSSASSHSSFPRQPPFQNNVRYEDGYEEEEENEFEEEVEELEEPYLYELREPVAKSSRREVSVSRRGSESSGSLLGDEVSSKIRELIDRKKKSLALLTKSLEQYR